MGSQINIEDLTDRHDNKGDDKPKSKTAATPKRPVSQKSENDLRDRIAATFERIADSREAREDDELADIIREDSAVMAQGLVSLTKPFKPLRTVVLVLVGVVEPLLAFQRVGRVLAARLIQRRWERDAQPEAFDPSAEPAFAQAE